MDGECRNSQCFYKEVTSPQVIDIMVESVIGDIGCKTQQWADIIGKRPKSVRCGSSVRRQVRAVERNMHGDTDSQDGVKVTSSGALQQDSHTL